MVVIKSRIKSTSRLTKTEWDDGTDALLQSLSQEELIALQELMKDPTVLDELNCLEYDEIPVPIDDWLKDPYYLGESSKGLYSCWRDDLNLLFTSGQYQIALISGSLGSGKSEFASLALLRMLYEASCLNDPARSYGLSSGSEIGFGLFAPSEQVARAAVFDKILGKINQSEYFQEVFAPKNQMREGSPFKGNKLIFPKGLFIVCGSSSNSASLGANIMGAVVDELNFFRTSQAARELNKYGAGANAGKMFDSLLRRIRSRFNKRGKLPGILIGSSSKTTVDDLLERFIKDAATMNDSSVFVRDYSILDVKPGSFSSKKFKVLVGSEHYSSKILAENEDISHLDDPVIVEIPEDLRVDFERSLDDALRDLAGIATIGIESFLSKVEKIDLIKNKKRSHPFLCPLYKDPKCWDSRLPYIIKWNEIAIQKENGEWEPRINPGMKRYVHLDPAISGDSFGFCISHIAGLIPVKNQKDKEDTITEYAPYFVVDFILKIQGSRSDEVLFRNVRKLIYDFSEHGFHIAKVTMDTYQSKETQQQLEAQGYKTEILSVDLTKDPYLHLKNAIYDGRIDCYDYNYLFEELLKLQNTPKKIDHLPNESKDLADALCGALYALSKDATYNEPILPMRGEFLELEEQKQKKLDEAELADSTKVVTNIKKNNSIAPKYRKVSSDGKIEELNKKAQGDSNTGSFFDYFMSG